MNELRFRHRMKERPVRKEAGEISFYIPHRMVSSKHETSLCMSFVSNRLLFGRAYSGLQPDYFRSMPPNSGVYVGLSLPTKVFKETVSKPGDIDLLVVPYENGELILERTLAIEMKVVRASFVRQGKSPNEFGFRQAAGLQDAGFPYVAVAHLIVSDESPSEAWRELGVARIIDETGRAEMLEPIMTDTLPIDLMQRSFGRLNKLVNDYTVGLVAAYVEGPDRTSFLGPGYWFPDTREATFNEKADGCTLERIAAFFDVHYEVFLDNPRW